MSDSLSDIWRVKLLELEQSFLLTMMSITLTKTQEQWIQTQLRTGKSNSAYWRIVRKGILGSSIASAILTQV